MERHNEDCNCEDNCNCGEDTDQITLTLDDGSEILCDVIAIFPCNDKEYIALLPVNAEEDSDVFLYQFIQGTDDEVELINIEDDDEFEQVTDAFDELLDTEEFNEIFDEDEEFDEDE